MNPLSHGSVNGPKEDSGSPAKQMADRWRKTYMNPEVRDLLQILSELLSMEELDLGDHSQLPEDHPIARAEYLLRSIYKFKPEVHV